MLLKYLYIQVRENQIVVQDAGNPAAQPLQADSVFSSQRLLIGDFEAALVCLKQLMDKARRPILPALFAHVVIHPLEKIEGGLAPLEERALIELAEQAGAAKAILWTGPILNNAEVLEKLTRKGPKNLYAQWFSAWITSLCQRWRA